MANGHDAEFALLIREMPISGSNKGFRAPLFFEIWIKTAT